MAEKHTPTPWFVSGVRIKMDGSEWHGIDRYDAAKKRDRNIACVGFDPRTGDGLADAHFIVRAVNSHDKLVEALRQMVVNSEADGKSYRDCHKKAVAALASLDQESGQ